MSTCNQLDLQTLRFQPVMLKKIPDHSFLYGIKRIMLDGLFQKPSLGGRLGIKPWHSEISQLLIFHNLSCVGSRVNGNILK